MLILFLFVQVKKIKPKKGKTPEKELTKVFKISATVQSVVY